MRRKGDTRLLSKVDYAVRLMIKNLPLMLPGYLELSYPYKDANTSHRIIISRLTEPNQVAECVVCCPR